MESEQLRLPGGSSEAQQVVAQLAAVRGVFDEDRVATEYDVLISTAVECLSGVSLTSDELFSAVRRVWAGANVGRPSFDGAMGAARDAELVVLDNGRWNLTATGIKEVRASRDWAESAMRITAEQLSEKARSGYRPLADGEATLWIGIIATALFAGIATAAGAYRGEIQLLPDQMVSPLAFDQTSVRRAIDTACRRADLADFLEACALAALDPSEPFGNDLVTKITTGYLLQAFMARRDSMRAREQVGVVSGQAAILDTPILIPLVGPDELAAPVELAIRTALDAQVNVVVCEHTIDELAHLMSRAERRYSVAINTAIRAGANVGILRHTIDDPLVEQFLLGFERGKFLEWRAFRDHVSELQRHLQSMGVAIVPHGNGPSDHVAELEDRLGSLLRERGKDRGPEQIARDANTMALAWRIRREKPAPGLLPSAWIVTTDTHMAIAYRRANRSDRTSITVAPSQWLSVLSVFADIPTVEELAKSAAVMLAQETLLRVASKYPAEVAIEIATALAPAGEGAEPDVRLAQLSLDELYTGVPVDAEGRPTGATIAARILEKRAARMEKLQQSERERVADERRRLGSVAEQAAHDVERERSLRIQAESDMIAERTAREVVEAGVANTLLLQRRSERRRVVAGIGIFASAVLLAWAARGIPNGVDTYALVVAVATGISTLWFWERSEAWAEDPAVRWQRVLFALIPESVLVYGLIQEISRLFEPG